MKILGIDPGIGRTGWGIIEVQSSQPKADRPLDEKFKVQSYGCIETEANTDIPGRLFALYDELCNIIKEYKPDALATEELFFNKNVKTALTVGQARGVILLAAVQAHLQITVYTPLQVKIAITGYGRAEKAQVGHMVKTLLKLSSIPKPDDTVDALAIALTHAFHRKIK